VLSKFRGDEYRNSRRVVNMNALCSILGTRYFVLDTKQFIRVLSCTPHPQEAIYR